MLEIPCKDADVICSYFEDRIGDLHADIEYIRSRAFYYKHEVCYTCFNCLFCAFCFRLCFSRQF